MHILKVAFRKPLVKVDFGEGRLQRIIYQISIYSVHAWQQKDSSLSRCLCLSFPLCAFRPATGCSKSGGALHVFERVGDFHHRSVVLEHLFPVVGRRGLARPDPHLAHGYVLSQAAAVVHGDLEMHVGQVRFRDFGDVKTSKRNKI
jgi:hypothetical protein